jgi:hypothetical protein
MKIFTLIACALLLIPIASFGQGYSIDWYVIGAGGGESNSANYRVNGTVGQPMTGASISTNYVVESGFWVDAGATSGYDYVPGDANMINAQWPPQVIGSDVTYLVGYFRALNPPCPLDGFYASGDANGDCLVIGSDVTKMVTYFRGLTELSFCPDYEPMWPTPADCPEEAPSGWPGCETPVLTIGKTGNFNLVE